MRTGFKDIRRHVAEHVFDQVHVILVILVGRHGFDHRELGMMAAVDAFVAKIAADGVNLVIAGDDEALEIKLV